MSLGVVGEILAGRFAEALVAPAVLVRVIRRVPDFILYPGDRSVRERFAFVESKAVGSDWTAARGRCFGRVPAG